MEMNQSLKQCECGNPMFSKGLCYGMYAMQGHGTQEEIRERSKLCGWSLAPKVSCRCLMDGTCRNYNAFYDGERLV